MGYNVPPYTGPYSNTEVADSTFVNTSNVPQYVGPISGEYSYTTGGDHEIDPDKYYDLDAMEYNTPEGSYWENKWQNFENIPFGWRLGRDFHPEGPGVTGTNFAQQIGHDLALDPDSYINAGLLFGMGLPNPYVWVPSVVGSGYQSLSGTFGLPSLGDIAEGTAKAVEYDPDARFYDRISGTSLPPITSEKDEFTEQQEIIHHGYSPATYDIGTGGKKMYY